MKPFLFILLIVSLSGNAQKLKVEYDKFEKAKRIETGWIQIKPTIIAPLAVRFRVIGDSAIFVTLGGGGVGANVIGESATIKFLFADETTTEAHSTGIQSYDSDQYGKGFRHQYRITREQLGMLARLEVKSVRKYDGDTYADFDIAKKNRDKLTEAASKVLAELDKKE